MPRVALMGLIALQLVAPLPFGAAFAATRPVPVRQLVNEVRIPYRAFTLANGLRVLIHTDRKTPVVAISVWYDIGSKQEPAGKTGYAHLFEHLMFNGSENATGDFFEPLQRLGATSMNGSTWFDRTNYFETVPTAALGQALFLESDRMGHLLGVINQTKLDEQRGVVKNEKRQGENQSFGLVEHAQLGALFPEGHPYAHPTIGSMADLDAASLDDMKAWFRAHYGPNNAVLVLAGDIDVAAAKPLVERYFGELARGPDTVPVLAPVPTLARRVDWNMKDRVSTSRLYRTWIVPGLNDHDTVPLSIGASVLGGISSSRLGNALVRKEKLAVDVSAELASFSQVGQFEIVVDVAPGVDATVVSARLDALIGELVADGPTVGEVARAATSAAADQIRGIESSGGKAATLAAGLLYSNDPDHYRKELLAYADATPASVRAAMRRWLSRPTLAINVAPGPRDDSQAMPVIAFAPQVPEPLARSARGAAGPAPMAAVTQPPLDRSHLPEVGPMADLQFPTVTRGRLSNGIGIVYAQRTAIPATQIALSAEAGFSADPRDRRGAAALMTALLTEGTTHLDSVGIAERQDELGASIGADSSMDLTTITLDAISDNLTPSLDLLADIALHPAFHAAEVERLRAEQLAGIATELTQPRSIVSRTLLPRLYGPLHPYGGPGTGSGDPDSVKRITRDDLVGFHQAWLRPDKVKIFVVSDRPLAAIQPLLEARFGGWSASGPPGAKHFDAAIPEPSAKVILIDRKDSPQSLIAAGQVLSHRGADDLLDLQTANEVVGGSFLSRINTDLRETKGWSYGVSARVGSFADRIAYTISAPVQVDQTGPSIVALLQDYKAFLSTDGVKPAEIDRVHRGDIRELPGAFETSGAVLRAMQTNDAHGRADSYYTTLPARYRRQSAADLDQAARAAIKPDQLLWIVVGDAAKVKPQLDGLGLAVELAPAL